MSDIYEFRTAPNNNEPFIFTVYGAQGITRYAIKAVERVVEFIPDLHLHVGDLSYVGNNIYCLWRWLSKII